MSKERATARAPRETMSLSPTLRVAARSHAIQFLSPVRSGQRCPVQGPTHLRFQLSLPVRFYRTDSDLSFSLAHECPLACSHSTLNKHTHSLAGDIPVYLRNQVDRLVKHRYHTCIVYVSIELLTRTDSLSVSGSFSQQPRLSLAHAHTHVGLCTIQIHRKTCIHVHICIHTCMHD